MLASITRMRAGRAGAQRQPAEVQAVVGDRQAVAAAAASSRFSAGTRKLLKCRPLLYACLQRVQAVVDDLELLVLLGRQIGDQHGRLAVDQARPGRSSGRGRRW